MSYDANGMARHHWPADRDGDGDVDSIDRDGLLYSLPWSVPITSANYDVDADVDRDGVVDEGDRIALSSRKVALPAGEVSAIGNDIAWDGYVFNEGTLDYLVRHRCYDPGLGRWLERDPLGTRPGVAESSIVTREQYSDGMNLYEASASNPIGNVDPRGLAVEPCPPKPSENHRALLRHLLGLCRKGCATRALCARKLCEEEAKRIVKLYRVSVAKQRERDEYIECGVSASLVFRDLHVLDGHEYSYKCFDFVLKATMWHAWVEVHLSGCGKVKVDPWRGTGLMPRAWGNNSHKFQPTFSVLDDKCDTKCICREPNAYKGTPR
ncbi:MAG: hypothetical protein KJO18_03725 [Acidimicrobiia bacterium]|nr:hypothetical protein [Acidimicrobiia bacterium]